MAKHRFAWEDQPEKNKQQNNLLIGTRPKIDNHKIIMTGGDGFDGYEIMEYKGMVWGISVRAKDIGQDFAMGCKHLSGGELTSYSKLGNESRQRAVDNMLRMASRLQANGIIHVDFEISGFAQGSSEVVVHGTAVVLQAIENYVPVGAAGNILLDIQQTLAKK